MRGLAERDASRQAHAKGLGIILSATLVLLVAVAAMGNLATANATEPHTRTLTAKLADGTVVTVEASTDAIPEGTTLEAKAVQNDAITEAVTAAAKADGTELTSVKAIDITLRDAAGTEVEPKSPVTVALSELGMNETGLSVYHVTAPDGNEAQATDAADLSVEKVESSTTDDNEQVFEAKSFSIYVVGQSKRLEVKFHQVDGSTKSIFVTKADLDAGKLNDIIYDPGAGTLTGKQAFKGWTTDQNWTVDSTGKDIDGVRADVAAKLANYSDGDVVDYYPVVVTTHRVTYVSEYGAAVHTDEVRVKGGESATYTVNYAHVPDKHEARFEGWSETKGSTTDVVKNGETKFTFIDTTPDKTLYAVVVDGAWFTFDAQADDASYTPPVFVQYGEKAAEPTKPPTRAGYTFGGWYTDKGCTTKYDFNATVGNTTKNTTLYAKWTSKPNATYTINYWKQSVTDDKNTTDHNSKTYDFAESETATAATGTKVSGGDTKSSYAGFHYGTSDADVAVQPNGSTVVNVYYDRDFMTINFMGPNTETTTTWHVVSEDDIYWYYGTPYYYDNGWHELQKNDAGEYGYYATETSLAKTEFTGLYGQTLAQNGYTWPGENNWCQYSDGSGSRHTFSDAFLFDDLHRYSWQQSNGTQSITLYGRTASGNATISHYKQGLDGTYGAAANTTKTASGSFLINNKYSGFEASQYSTNGGRTWSTAIAGTTTVRYNNSLMVRYTRKSYALTFFDGAYEVPNGETTLSFNDAPLLTSDNTILYEAPLNEAKDVNGNLYKDYKPGDKDGYIFAGWYKDKACTVPFDFNTTMPLDGTKAYAKWTKLQYDVVLHDGSANGNDYIGGYETPTDVNYGDRVAEPTANRGDEWVLVGWYTDSAFTQPYTFDYKLNATTEATLGVKTNVHTDKNGMTQDYIKGQLNLYAKWRHVLVGAKGITVVYDAGAGNTVNGNQTYTDISNVYQDGATAAATSAAQYKDETQKFQYWVVQKWDSAQNKYVDTDVKVFPGNTFTVNYADARQTANDDNTADKPSYTYTVQLRAVYADATPETTTVIFDANGGAGNDYVANAVTNTNQNTTSYEVNTQIAIPGNPSREGYTFLGWSGTQKDAWTQEEWGAVTAFTAETSIESGKDYKLADGVAYYADNLTGFAKSGDKTNTVYACWKRSPVTLTIQKEITGAQADLTKGYTFEVTVTRDGKAAGSYTTDKLYDRQGEKGEGQPVTLGGTDKTGLELLWGDVVTVTETDNTGYTTTYTTQVGTDAASASQDGTSAELTLNGNGKVVFTNTKTDTPVTGVTTGGVPRTLGIAAMVALAIAGAFALAQQRDLLELASVGKPTGKPASHATNHTCAKHAATPRTPSGAKHARHANGGGDA